MSTEIVYDLIPEFALILVATLIYVVGAFFPARRGWGWIALGAIALAGVVLFAQGMATETTGAAAPASWQGPLKVDAAGHIDELGQYIRWLALVVGAALVLLSAQPDKGVQEPEFIGTLLLAISGAMLVGSAGDLVLFFLGVELISIPTYVLLYLGRQDAASPEAAVKYFFLSILSSALTLYGFSFLYGVGRSTDLVAIQNALAAEAADPTGLRMLAAVAMVLIFAGMGFKVAAAPFHFYAPDVYQGTTNGNAGVLAVLPKIAGFVALVRITAVAMPGLETFGWRIALVLAVLTMTVGNVIALWQDNIRRLLAYSSIAHAGYMLIGLAVGFATVESIDDASRLDGVGALLFYLTVYALATAGTFAALTYLGGGGRQIDGVDELAGLARTHPTTALCLAVFMFSLAGLPPLAGFWGKYSLFYTALNVDRAPDGDSLLRMWFLFLAVAGALNAAIAAAYYLRIISAMYFRPSLATARGEGGLGAAVAACCCALLVVLIGAFPGPLMATSGGASQSSRASLVAPAADGAARPSPPRSVGATVVPASTAHAFLSR
ncbi:MAG TPA: NADH-quinone oxidoreductase subunit N [Pirellulales bacterium]|nr:NADH-quinone oxidoreductase subunit N [Pirellulales bacterium]